MAHTEGPSRTHLTALVEPGQSDLGPTAGIRIMAGHRIMDIGGRDWCIGCGWEPHPAVECRAGKPRCDSCGVFPADYNDHGHRVCSTCWSSGEAHRG